MAYNFFAYIARMKYISRWGLMRNSVQENIQEHSHMVAVLAHTLAVIRRDVLDADCDPGAAPAGGPEHRRPENFTRGPPPPRKVWQPQIRDAYKAVEAVSADKLLSMLPTELRPAYAPWLREDYDPSLRALVKAADKLSAYIKCVEGLKAGNNEFRQAPGQNREGVKAMGLPEAEYFIEHFLPAFGLTLDELQ